MDNNKPSELSAAERESLLELPNKRNKTIRVVLDTDFNNEIDDFFALTWLLLPNDKIEVEAIYEAPFSFRHRLEALLQANELINCPPGNLTKKEEELIATYKGQIEAIEKRGIDPKSLADPGSHVALSPKEGMNTRYEKLLEFNYTDYNSIFPAFAEQLRTYEQKPK